MSTSIYIGTWTLSRTVALIFGGQEGAYWGLNWSAVQAEGTLSRGKNQAWLDFKLSSAGPRLYSLLVSRCSGWWYLVEMMKNMLLMLMSVLTNINTNISDWNFQWEYGCILSALWVQHQLWISLIEGKPPQIGWRLQDSTICGALIVSAWHIKLWTCD